MKVWRSFKATQALFIGVFAFAALSISHVSLMRSVSDMGGMHDHSSNAVQCQILCTAAVTPEKQNPPLSTKENDNAPNPALLFAVAATLSSLAVAFVVKLLHRLSSWRPPDRVLLYGRYSDGL